MTRPLLSVRQGMITFGGKPLFEDLSLHIYSGDRICLVGRNGEGKSTLLKIISKIYELDSGEMWTLPGLKIGYLPQQSNYENCTTIEELVMQGLPKEEQTTEKNYLVDIVLRPLGLEKNMQLNNLSGGQLRRAFLAAALISEPDVLLLDEPTNHLDISTVEWLEEYLSGFKGAILVISHDRTFLRNVSNRTFWLDRGILRSNDQGYWAYEEWSIAVLEEEQRQLEKMEQKLAMEQDWLHGGVTARRKRNQRRLSEMYAMREKITLGKAALKKLGASLTLDPLSPALSSKLVVEFDQVTKSYADKKIIDGFSYRLMRGDKVGIVGNNGAGKSTLLKLLVGEMQPDEGRIKLGKTVTLTYFDQNRIALDPEETLWSTLCPTGGDQVKVGDKTMHVCAYLKRFLFDPKQARDKVATLSGGQANRLMLAVALACPGSFLILDEPTNDLDMDTLDMIQEILADYQGTLLLVSHDRDFIDRVVTKTLVFKGNAEIEEFWGGYEQYKNYLRNSLPTASTKKVEKSEKDTTTSKAPSGKLSYKIARELEVLPQEIESIEIRIAELEAKLSEDDLFSKQPEQFSLYSKELMSCKEALEMKMLYWLEIEEKYGNNQ